MEPEEWIERERRKSHGYEAEKNKIKRLNLSAEEYEKAIVAVIERLKL